MQTSLVALLPLLTTGVCHVQGSTSLRTPTSSSNGHVQMQVARFVKPGQRDPPIHKLVPPPRQGKAAAQQLVRTEKEAGQRHPAAGLEQRTSAHNRAVRAEMASMATELQTKKSQLGKADIALRQGDLTYTMLSRLQEVASKSQHSKCTAQQMHIITYTVFAFMPENTDSTLLAMHCHIFDLHPAGKETARLQPCIPPCPNMMPSCKPAGLSWLNFSCK